MAVSPYFDSLPLHPMPRRLESLSSYILRLADANQIQSIQVLSSLFGVPVATLTRLADYPFLSFGMISTRANIVQEKLQATTFCYFGEKFGRSTRPSPLARFLKGSLGSHLRYCPACLSETGYYSLLWRFLTLHGCATHRCYLLENCGHCDTPISLFGLPLKAGVCSACGGDLSRCRTERLSEQETWAASKRTSDLEYLLTPHPLVQEDALAKRAGRRLLIWRQEKRLFAQWVAHHLGVPENQIGGIERGGVNQGAPFSVYVRYVDYLGISLRDLFADTCPSPGEQEELSSPAPAIVTSSQQPAVVQGQRESKLIKCLQEAIPQLKALGKPLTTRAVSQFVGTTPQGLQHYPMTKALWEQITQEIHADQEQCRQQREEELMKRVQEAITTLIASKQYPSQEAISKLVNMSPGGLRYYPRVRTLIHESMAQHYRSRSLSHQLPEEEVVTRVHTAIADLRSSKQPVTQQQISGRLGLSLHRLKVYPQVKAILDRVTEEGRRQRKQQATLHGQTLAEQVQEAIQQLYDQGQPMSRQIIGKMVDLTPRALARYHPVRPLLTQIVGIYRANRPQRTKQRERALLKQVRQAIKQLQEQDQPITQKAVSQQLGLTAPALMYYPGFRKIYRRMAEENKRARRKQVHQREVTLVERVQAIIFQMSREGVPLTFRNISKLVGMSVASLRRYPSIKALLQQIAEARRNA